MSFWNWLLGDKATKSVKSPAKKKAVKKTVKKSC
jgi:hypothetical protein